MHAELGAAYGDTNGGGHLVHMGLNATECTTAGHMWQPYTCEDTAQSMASTPVLKHTNPNPNYTKALNFARQNIDAS